MRAFLPSVLIGAAAGFAALLMRDAGLIIAGAVTLLVGAAYVLRRRYHAFAWLLNGLALPWLIVLGPIAVGGLVDRQRAATGPETYVGVLGAIVVAAFGIALLLVMRPRRAADPESPESSR